ncbi:MAG: hypothetical protein GC164_08375 [Phycisphaera sp.]|nr:hypothetical protein [Phycisphaera sp.]
MATTVQIGSYFIPFYGLLIGLAVNSVGAGYERYLDGEGNVVMGGFADATGLSVLRTGLSEGDPWDIGLGALGVVASVSGLRQGMGFARVAYGRLPVTVRSTMLSRPVLLTTAGVTGTGLFLGSGVQEAEGAVPVAAVRGALAATLRSLPRMRGTVTAGTSYGRNIQRLRNAVAAELRHYRALRANTDFVLIGGPGRIGSHGADSVAFSRSQGKIILFDVKNRSSSRRIVESLTFGRVDLRKAAATQAYQILKRSKHLLTLDEYSAAHRSIQQGSYATHTVGFSNARNSISRFY